MAIVGYDETISSVRKRSEFLDVPFDPMPFKDVVSEIHAFDEGSPFKYIVTPNVDHIVRIKRDKCLKEYYDNAWLSLCDSSPVSAFATLMWVDLPIVTGADLTECMFRDVIRDGDKVTLIVANDEIAVRAIKEFPNVNFRYMVPPQNLLGNANALKDCVEFVAEQPARFVFIAVGSPQSERIAFGLSSHPDARGLAICCGASIEFLVGIQRRAPRLLRGSGFEWLFRMLNNPKRLFRRYMSSLLPLLQLMSAELFKTIKVRR